MQTQKTAQNTPAAIKTLPDYIERFADEIYVREQIDGEWGTYALTDLPVRLAIHHAMRLAADGYLPVRGRREGDL
jgi:hypothetical protein